MLKKIIVGECMIHEINIEIGGKTINLQTGLLAKQANGSVVARCEGATVLATVCCSKKANMDLDFIPLSVEYNEKYYAAGKIPGGFLKREARPKDKEILVSRLIDRPMRPLFSKEFMREIQLVPTVLSTDQVHPPDIIAINAASAAVLISDIPFDGPIGAVRVVYLDGDFIINPTFEEIEKSKLEIIVAGTEEGVTMVEGGAHEVSEEILLQAIDIARPNIKKLCDAQKELAALCPKENLPFVEIPALALKDELISYARSDMKEACFVKGKEQRVHAIDAVIKNTIEHFKEQIEDADMKKAYAALDSLEQEIVRSAILSDKIRTDGRGLAEVRPIECHIGLVPRTHGSALFTRGETQALAFVTLGTARDEQIHDDIDGDRRDRFLLHYNFPPYSVGETGRLGTGRREIGHGNLAYRALEPMLPDKKIFPYTMRVVSEVLESNGSSSMATVCSGSMALMEAGVHLPKSVAGIAMGLIKEGDNTAVLSDILGEEDHLGDMDFKVAGTRDGITAFQMDIKIKNIDETTMKTALNQAKEGRMHILDIMEKTISTPDDLSEYAPRILSVDIKPDQIGILIGSGGKTIRSLQEKYKVEINIDDNGHVTIYGSESKLSSAAKENILQLLEEPEVGKEYNGIVKRIMDFGAFIEILPGKDGLCHISRISKQRIKSVEDVLKVNDEVKVSIIEIDRVGKINLAMLTELKID